VAHGGRIALLLVVDVGLERIDGLLQRLLFAAHLLEFAAHDEQQGLSRTDFRVQQLQFAELLLDGFVRLLQHGRGGVNLLQGGLALALQLGACLRLRLALPPLGVGLCRGAKEAQG
jgi:hypothetical protein